MTTLFGDTLITVKVVPEIDPVKVITPPAFTAEVYVDTLGLPGGVFTVYTHEFTLSG
jgi:hypothetical protein